MGTAGADGSTVLNGSGAPAAGLGATGDFYLDTVAEAMYGPKTGAGWGASTALMGPAGAQGSTGAQGSAGSQGSQGVQGVQGATGAPGTIGAQGPQGTQGFDGAQGATGAEPRARAQGGGTTGQDATVALGTGNITIATSNTTFQVVPGLTLSPTIPSNTVVLITYNVGMYVNSNSDNAAAAVEFSVYVDGAVQASSGMVLAAMNGSGGSTPSGNTPRSGSAMTVVTLSAGSHTIDVRTKRADKPAAPATTWGTSASAIVSSDGTETGANEDYLQGRLSVVILGK